MMQVTKQSFLGFWWVQGVISGLWHFEHKAQYLATDFTVQVQLNNHLEYKLRS